MRIYKEFIRQWIVSLGLITGVDEKAVGGRPSSQRSVQQQAGCNCWPSLSCTRYKVNN
mgnify:CR=1 FL=1